MYIKYDGKMCEKFQCVCVSTLFLTQFAVAQCVNMRKWAHILCLWCVQLIKYSVYA